MLTYNKMPKIYIFIDRNKVGGCDKLEIGDVRDLQALPVGVYRVFSVQWFDTAEFQEYDMNPNYRKVVL